MKTNLAIGLASVFLFCGCRLSTKKELERPWRGFLPAPLKLNMSDNSLYTDPDLVGLVRLTQELGGNIVAMRFEDFPVNANTVQIDLLGSRTQCDPQFLASPELQTTNFEVFSRTERAYAPRAYRNACLIHRALQPENMPKDMRVLAYYPAVRFGLGEWRDRRFLNSAITSATQEIYDRAMIVAVRSALERAARELSILSNQTRRKNGSTPLFGWTIDDFNALTCSALDLARPNMIKESGTLANGATYTVRADYCLNRQDIEQIVLAGKCPDGCNPEFQFLPIMYLANMPDFAFRSIVMGVNAGGSFFPVDQVQVRFQVPGDICAISNRGTIEFAFDSYDGSKESIDRFDQEGNIAPPAPTWAQLLDIQLTAEIGAATPIAVPNIHGPAGLTLYGNFHLEAHRSVDIRANLCPQRGMPPGTIGLRLSSRGSAVINSSRIGDVLAYWVWRPRLIVRRPVHDTDLEVALDRAQFTFQTHPSHTPNDAPVGLAVEPFVIQSLDGAILFTLPTDELALSQLERDTSQTDYRKKVFSNIYQQVERAFAESGKSLYLGFYGRVVRSAGQPKSLDRLLDLSYIRRHQSWLRELTQDWKDRVPRGILFWEAPLDVTQPNRGVFSSSQSIANRLRNIAELRFPNQADCIPGWRQSLVPNDPQTPPFQFVLQSEQLDGFDVGVTPTYARLGLGQCPAGVIGGGTCQLFTPRSGSGVTSTAVTLTANRTCGQGSHILRLYSTGPSGQIDLTRNRFSQHSVRSGFDSPESERYSTGLFCSIRDFIHELATGRAQSGSYKLNFNSNRPNDDCKAFE